MKEHTGCTTSSVDIGNIDKRSCTIQNGTIVVSYRPATLTLAFLHNLMHNMGAP